MPYFPPGGGVSDHGALTGLADDDHTAYATNAEFDDHSARHEDGGADEISIAALAGTPAAVTDHLNDATDAHDASAISFVPDGNIAATNVQAAIVEVRDEASGSGIPAAVVDAKGDLIAATAADTVARLAVGTNTHVLTADSAEATGLKWAAAPGAGSGIPETLLDAKGDIIVASAADTAARLAAGTNGYMLTAQSAQSTGLLWAIAPTYHGVKAYKTTQTRNNAEKVIFDVDLWDTDGYHDTVTNNTRFTIPTGLGGKYLVEASSFFGASVRLEVFVNGAIVEGRGNSGYAANYGNTIATLSLAATDYIEINVASGGSVQVGDSGSVGDYTVCSVSLLGI